VSTKIVNHKVVHQNLILSRPKTFLSPSKKFNPSNLLYFSGFLFRLIAFCFKLLYVLKVEIVFEFSIQKFYCINNLKFKQNKNFIFNNKLLSNLIVPLLFFVGSGLVEKFQCLLPCN
jgi:hypothetical protein